MKLAPQKQPLYKIAVIFFILVNTSLLAWTQTKFFSHPASNDQFAFSASNENYTFYSVSAGNTDGGFRYMGIIREDKKSKDRVVMYEGKPFSHLNVYGEWLYFEVWSDGNGYMRRTKIDGSKVEWLKTGDYPFFYKNRIYYTESNTLKFVDLKTDKISIASKEISQIDAICNDDAVYLDHINKLYIVAAIDPTTGVVTSIEQFKLNGLEYYYKKGVIVNGGYIYYYGGRDEDKELYLDETSALYRSKLRDASAIAEPIAYPPTTKTGASLDMRVRIGTAVDDNYIYINYRGMGSPNNGEIWRYSLDGKEKKRVTILLTDKMSKCEEWLYTMGHWTWEQKRTNINTGKQELLFSGKAEDLAALSTLKHVVETPEYTLYPNYPSVLVDKQHKYAPMGYSLSTRNNAVKYYRIADIAMMLSKTKKAFNHTMSDNKATLTFGPYNPIGQVKERPTNIAIAAYAKKGTLTAGTTSKPITYYEADGEYFFLFRDILAILNVNVNGSNITTTANYSGSYR